MIKLVLLLAAFGSVVCETHDQQVEYANRLIYEIRDISFQLIDMIRDIRENTEEGKFRLVVHANSLNFNTHLIVDRLQHVVLKNDGETAALQEVVLKLNKITFLLEKSMNSSVEVFKSQLQLSVEEIITVAENLRTIIVENVNLAYTSTVLHLLDELVNVIYTDYLRAAIYGSSRSFVKTFILLSQNVLGTLLDLINSTNINVQNDIVRYSSKLSSAISKTGRLLNDLTFTYKTNNMDAVKEIIYSLSIIVKDNDEVLCNENSIQKIKKQFRVTLENFGKQLYKIIDAGYCSEWTIQDKNLIYVIPEIIALSIKLERNLQKTIDNYIDVKSI